MRLLFLIPLLLLLSCKKDKVPEPVVCTGVSMAGERELFVGKWRWYSTTVERWYDVGPSDWLEYTPDNQGFEFYFTISSEGILKSYRNGILENETILSKVDFESITSVPDGVISFEVNCDGSQKDVDLYTSSILGSDTIYHLMFPFDFDDEENHLRSRQNYFERE